MEAEFTELREEVNYFEDNNEELEDPTNFSIDYRKDYKLANDEWKYDSIPEIIDGKNIADFIDPDIDKKLAELEAEEEEAQKLFLEGINENVKMFTMFV